jgi:hypothetical protein
MLLSLACSDPPTSESSFAVADSAGVEVVATSEPTWADGSPWTLELRAEIGVLEGAEEYLFGDPGGVALVPGGQVAVADNQTGDVRFYSENGEFVRRAGSQGEGPGEFRSFAWLSRCGSTLIAYDIRLRRTTPVSYSGEVGDPSPFRTGEENRPPYYSKCLPDGTFLAVGWGEAPPRPDGAEYWMFTQRADVWRLSTEGVVDTIGEFISSERVGMFDRDRGPLGSGPHPFSRSVKFAGDEEHIYVGGAERLQIEVRSLDGELLRIFRGPDSELAVTDDFLAEYERAELEGSDAELRDMLADADPAMPNRYPAYSELLLDDLGYVWVERFVLPWEQSRRWGVFSPDGTFLGHLSVDPRFQVMDVSSDRLAGLVTDDLGVARVRVYELTRN